MKILVIRFSSMGDVILTTPLFTYLKQQFPETEITLLTNTLYADLFQDDPRLTAIIPFSRDREQEILSECTSRSWDRIIDLQNNRRSRGIRKKYFPAAAGERFNKLHVKRWLLLLLRLNYFNSHSSVAQRYMRASGISPKTIKNIPPVKLHFNCDKAKEPILFHDKNSPVMALFPFSAWRNKQWSMASYKAVGRHFIRKGWRIALFGGPEDAANAETLKHELGERCYSFAGLLNLYDVGCYLTQCALALGNDTGLSHLARACGVQTGIIYGATTSHFGFFPYGDPLFQIFESKQFCRPCHAHGGNRCWRVSRPCLGTIKEDAVVKGLEELITP